MILCRPGAVPKLLGIAGKSADAEEFSDVLLQAVNGISLPQAATLDELQRLLQQARLTLQN